MDLALAISPVHRDSELVLQAGQLNAVNASSLAAQPVVLQLVEPSRARDGSQRSPQWHPLVVERMSRLVEMVGQLRSPDSGWPSDQPQTAEAIAPYVMEEVEDVIAAWRAANQTPPELPSPPTASELTPWQGYILLDSLEAWLVWTAARSAYETMRLLEGMAARVTSPGMAQQRGIVRLAIVLELQAPHHRWEVDLVTRQAPPTLLPLDAIIYTPGDAPCPAALDVGRLLQTVTTQIRATTPEAGQFLNGVSVNSLVPQYPWQRGLLQIRLGLQFIPDALDPVLQDAIASPSTPPLGDPAPESHSTTPERPCRLRVTDGAWQQRYRDQITQQQLAALLHRTSLAAKMEQESASSPSATGLIDDAIALVDPLNALLALTGRLFLLHELTIEDGMTRLLWYFNRGSRETMQLMGGVSAQYLRPGSGWATGVLRLQPLLWLHTPEQDWSLDLVTGQPALPGSETQAEAIVQIHHADWTTQPRQLASLRQRLLDELEQITPELPLLLAGTAVSLSTPSGSIGMGTLRLVVEFSFTAMPRR